MAKRTIASTNISIGANLTGLQRGLKIAQRSLRKFGASAKRMGSSITSNVTLPFVAAGAAGVKLATDLETSFAKIENLVGITGQALQDFKNSVREVSAATGQSQQQLSEALFTVASAGLRGAQATDVLEMSAKASAIGLGETQQVAQALTGVLQAYAKSGLTASEATDTLTAIVREGNLEAEALAPTLGRVVGIAAQLGISFQEVGANIATFTRLGVPAEEAVVGLRGVMTTFLKPTTEAEKALETLGLTAADLREMLGTQGLQSTLQFLMQSFKGNDEALASVFGNVRALSAVLGTAGAQGETYAQVLNNISNATGIVDQGFENVSKTSGFQFQQTLNTLKTAAIELGAALLPMVKEFADAIVVTIDYFKSLSSETKETVLTIIALVAAFGPLLTAVGFLSANLIPTLISGFTALLNPIGLATLAVGALAAMFLKSKINAFKMRAAIRAATDQTISLDKATEDLKKALDDLEEARKNGSSQEEIRALRITAKLRLDEARAAYEQIRAGRELAIQQHQNKIRELERMGASAKAIEITKKLTGNIDLFTEQLKASEESIAAIEKRIAALGENFDDVNTNINETGQNSYKAAKNIDRLKLSFDGLHKIGQEMEEGVALPMQSFFDSIKNNVGVVRMLVFELGNAFTTVFTEIIDTALGNTKQSFAEMVDGVLQSLGRLIKRLIATAAAAAVLVALLAATGIGGFSVSSMKTFTTGFKSVFGMMSGLRLAKGGLAFGETLAVVGDNPNARMDPEVIAPLSKLKNILAESGGGGRVEVYGRISGQDILLSSEKATRTRSRFRGY